MNTISATVGSTLADATDRLRAAGSDTARLDAELLLGEALGLDRAHLVIERDRDLSEVERDRFGELIERRERREPVAYILGRQAFRHLELAVDERVLIPRPETEMLVEAALDLPAGTRVVDVGTGSGAISLALKHERPDLEVIGIDVSLGALAVARSNARRLALDVDFIESDLLAAVPDAEVVLANLPYIAEPELGDLAPEIASYEPELAYMAGHDGLWLVRRLLPQLGTVRMVAFELGLDQARAVAELLAEQFAHVEIRLDLAGIERVVLARR